jgi:hypothetical protein
MATAELSPHSFRLITGHAFIGSYTTTARFRPDEPADCPSKRLNMSSPPARCTQQPGRSASIPLTTTFHAQAIGHPARRKRHASISHGDSSLRTSKMGMEPTSPSCARDDGVHPTPLHTHFCTNIIVPNPSAIRRDPPL